MPLIKIKNSAVQNKQPNPVDLEVAELAVNVHEDSVKLYTKDKTNQVRMIGGNGTGEQGKLGYWERNGTDLYPVNGGTDSVKIGGTLSASPNINLNAAGSSFFVNDMNIGGTEAVPKITLGSSFGIVHANGLAFDKTYGNVAHVSYNGFYRSAATHGPILAVSALQSRDKVTGLRINSYAYVPSTNTNVRLDTYTGIGINPPVVNIGPTGTGIVDHYEGIHISNISADRINAGGSGIGINSLLNHQSVTGKDTYNFYASGNAPNYFAGQISTHAGAVATGVATPSDSKFKKDIQSAASQLNDVKALAAQLVNYSWNDDAPWADEVKGTRSLGLIAQEVEKISPKLVTEVTMPGKQELVSGSEATDDAEYKRDPVTFKTIKTDVIVMKMLGAIGELANKIEALEAKS